MASTSIRFSCVLVLQLVLSLLSEAGVTGYGLDKAGSRRLYGRAAAVSGTLPTGWSSKGCYTDNVNGRALSSKTYGDGTGMTEETCISFCANAGYNYAGVEYSSECYCANSIGNGGVSVAASDCSMTCSGNAAELCGGPNRLNVFYNPNIAPGATGPSTNPGVPHWGFLGCYTDSGAARTLPINGNPAGGASQLTVAICASACQSGGYSYAGVEYAGECYCGNAFGNGGGPAPDGLAGCNMICNGNSTEYCGGPNRLDVYGFNQPSVLTQSSSSSSSSTTSTTKSSTTTSSTTTTKSSTTSSTTTKTSSTTASTTKSTSSTTASVTTTSSSTTKSSTTTSISPTTTSSSTTKSSTTTSSSTTSSSSTASPSWSALGCYAEGTGGRALTYGATVLGGAANMTIENCQSACLLQKYSLAGVEYSGECYCGNSFSNGGGPAPDGNAQCTMTCNGNTAEICGGPNRLNVYSYSGAPAASTTTTSATSTGTGSASSLPTSWTYRGCYVDNAYGRILNGEPGSSTLTVESCVSTCIGLGYTIAGMEYSTQCYCGSAIVNGGALAASDSDCAMTCGGNSNEVCGGPNRMSVYATGTVTSYAAPAPQTSNLPTQWAYKGCLGEPNGGRVFSYQTDFDNNATIPNCLNLCQQFGYGAAGVEYGVQCFCGDDTDRVNAGVSYLSASSCSMSCSGDPTALCGGPNAISYYTLPQPINNWPQAVGNAAGQYSFLLGGVVIPLITAVGINGKVTFVEKHGTGPPNSTGAYELDLSQVNNFNAAWRTMNGVKTDVFCSAGLTLPDKVGRQINIGGWSADSLYGVRLYWPDGSPGVPGVNDWQENVQEVALQTGRWYPTAMQLVNGSILIVGGENGSNGPPVPNLEVLPQPAGGNLVYCDWLNRTDPNNLYPFLAVLPSGGVFVAYYNEARILDEKTFQTTKTLPNIPGAVNNFLGGRTYPLEGTAMLMPQKAPYSDPLTVLICGGSTPYQGFALDNCVSIKPEVAGATWVLERMPSRRVISNIVALPDGTYLILNGAEQGQAGFGLASKPNHNAVLYDPTQPLYSRFTQLANTTIDRLYHSEAILLLDGTVLVTGSDPEGAPYAQEYRVETFTPSYLMGVADSARPAYTITKANTDWAYGKSYTITLTSGTASKISLMKAVTSTHGNSMGQRTIFPAFSCAGSTCTITAPPNGYITGGPGWHMLFVLNAAGVPSRAQWVRIGGDPAGLGNWPNFPDFTVPGV